MFLNELNQKEKEAFINLCYYAVKDDAITEGEKELLVEYCREMGISSYFFDDDTMSMETIKDIFKQSEKPVKKIVLLELLGMMYADGCYDISEQDFVKALAVDIDLEEADVETQNNMLRRYMDLVGEMTVAINS
ncbi:MAG: hypothetical protein LIO86_15570 [Lachnospiraceae bacterium]|nr:hypothetical protein [Lachnospiraceae bacterium]